MNLGNSIMKEIAWQMKGKVAKCDHREYGFAQLQVCKFEGSANTSNVDALFESLGEEMQVRRLNVYFVCCL